MKRKTICTQDIRDYLSEHPNSTAEVIATHIGVTTGAMRSKLRCMIDYHQVSTEKVNGVLHYTLKRKLPFGVSDNAYLLNSLLRRAKSQGGVRA
ncbi:TPA: hypothetical protein ACGB3K_005165 [Klebsiella aerogenes]